MARDAFGAAGSGTVDIRVLGPVEVSISGKTVDIGHARQRVVLAILTARVGEVVSMGHLAEQLWGQRPPQRSRDTLYSYLSRLRKIFAGTPVSIRRRSGGYLLETDPAAVDMNRFRELVARARQTGDLADWDAAQALWRGEPFAELDVPLLDNLRATLDAEQFAAALDRNDALLRHGEHNRALPGLNDLAERYPWDERLAGQLMLALYRCGRPSEALDHYRRLSTRLVGQRGVEPGPALSKLHREILCDDPALTPDPKPAAPVVPRQLPGDTPGFAGRGVQLRKLDDLVRADGPTVGVLAITGTAGIGKTALAVHWAHRAAERFPDGQLYVNLRGFGPSERVVTPAEAIHGFLDGLGVAPKSIPADFEAQTALYRSHVAARRILVVLDNARDAEQVRPLLPGGSQCATLVTSRNALTGLLVSDAATSLPIDSMPLPDCRRLLANRIGATRITDPSEADDLIEACARLPLALSIVAARTITDPGLTLSRLTGQLRDERTKLDQLDAGDDVANVRAVFSWSYRALSTGAARLFRLLSLHPRGEISAEAAASLAGTGLGPGRRSLTELVDAGLLSRQGRDFGFHDLLFEYSRELCLSHESEPDTRAAVARVLNHFLRSAYAASRLASPYRRTVAIDVDWAESVASEFETGDEAVDWLRSRKSVLLAGVRLAAEHGLDRCVTDLAWSLSDFLNRNRHCEDGIAAQRQAVAAAHRLGDRAALGRAHRGMARGLTVLGRLDEAERELRTALAIFEELGDDTCRANVLAGFGFLHNERGDHAAGLEVTLRAVKLFRAGGHEAELIRELGNAGWFHAQLGDHEAAVAYCVESLELAERSDELTYRNAQWSSLGYIAFQQGDHRQAIEYYEYALAIDRSSRQDRPHEAATLGYLAQVHEAVGEFDRARSYREEARAIAAELGLPDPVAEPR